MATAASVAQGDVWMVNLNPTVGYEQSGDRPAVVVSNDHFHRSGASLVVVMPVTTQDKGQPLHVRVDPPEGGLDEVSFVKVEDIRSISEQRLRRHRGKVTPETLRRIQSVLQMLTSVPR